MKASMTILAEYDNRVAILKALTAKLRTLIEELLARNNIRVHAVTSRLKSRESLAAKLDRSDQRYEALSDITDICGIRVTTYFADDVDKVASILQREFEVDVKNSLDKRAALDPDRFGYLSMHHVLSLAKDRASLTEYNTFKGFPVEVQTRSILQHAWAEIEHDLGYKSSLDVPREVRRRFSRLAGLLEVADQEFGVIREELSKYEADLPKRIALAPKSVTLDKASVSSFIRSSQLVKSIDRRIAKQSGNTLKTRLALSPAIVPRLAILNVTSIEQLERELDRTQKPIERFASQFLTGGGDVRAGISVFYLCYILAAELKGDVLERLAKSVTLEGWKAFSDRILTTYEKAIAKTNKK